MTPGGCLTKQDRFRDGVDHQPEAPDGSRPTALIAADQAAGGGPAATRVTGRPSPARAAGVA